MKRCFLLALFCILLLSGCGGIKITKPMLRMIVSRSDKVSTNEALAWFIGPRYEDKPYLESLSPRTFIGSYKGPLFVSTSRHDFIRGHVHNVINQDLPDSKTVNSRMLEFMKNNLQ